jgi:hypothetical protein
MNAVTNAPQRKSGGATGGNQYGAYQVRHASDKQVSFIKKLLEQKDYSKQVDLDNLNVQGAGDLINELLACSDKQGYVALPSDKQLSFARNLIKNKDGGMELLNQLLQSHNVNSLEQLPKVIVSGIINTLKSAPEQPLAISEVGAYLSDGTIYSIRLGKESQKFQVWYHDTTQNKYVREANGFTEKDLLKKLQPTDRLTLELAIKYSAQTGICVHCGRTLTLRKSVVAGMGQVCASKYH